MTPAALATLLLLSAAGPAAPSPPPAAPPDATAPATGERVDLDVRFPPWQFTGTFTLTVGALRDEGVARDRGSLLGPRHQVERVLEGRLGTLTLQLDTRLRGAIYPPIFGVWRVVAATGAYAGRSGGGTFTAVDAGGRSGSPFERQTLLGRLSPARPGAR